MKPFEITRWDAPGPPSLSILQRWLQNDNLSSITETMAIGAHTPEVKYDRPVVRLVVSGSVQYSFPGYGVVEVFPGDQLDLAPDVLHDVKNTGNEPVVLLCAER